MPRGPGEGGVDGVMGAFGSQVDRLRVQGRSAFSVHDSAIEIADLVFDSIVDSPVGRAGEVRHLRFAAPACTVEVDVMDKVPNRLEVRVAPTADVVKVRTVSADDGSTVTWNLDDELVSRPTLTSLLVSWNRPEFQPIRTAWVLL